MAKQTKQEKAKIKLAKEKEKAEKKAAKEKEKAEKAKGKQEPKLVDHTVIQEDLDNNPQLVADGIQVGDVIQLPVFEKPFHIKVEVNGEIFEADTNAIAETLLELNPGQLKTKVVINVTFFDQTAEFVLFNHKAKQVFNHPLAAQFFEKNVRLALNAR